MSDGKGRRGGGLSCRIVRILFGRRPVSQLIRSHSFHPALPHPLTVIQYFFSFREGRMHCNEHRYKQGGSFFFAKHDSVTFCQANSISALIGFRWKEKGASHLFHCLLSRPYFTPWPFILVLFALLFDPFRVSFCSRNLTTHTPSWLAEIRN